MKKFAFFVAVALCLTLCLMIPASAEESAEEPALESEGFRWCLLEDGTAEILKYTGEELRLILPEVYLEDGDVKERVERIHAEMDRLAEPGMLRELGEGFVYTERQVERGVRRGLVGLVDLERYDMDACLLYTSPSPRDKRQSRMPSSA